MIPAPLSPRCSRRGPESRTPSPELGVPSSEPSALMPLSFKRWTLGALVFSVGSGALALSATQSAQHPIALTGRDWARLDSGERDAYLAGFIAGAAAYQATRGHRSVEGARAAAEAARLRRNGDLAFPFRENVYRSHLDDYYFYENRRDHTLIRAIIDMNLQLQPRQ